MTNNENTITIAGITSEEWEQFIYMLDKQKDFTPKSKAICFNTEPTQAKINELIENYNKDSLLVEDYTAKMAGADNKLVNKLTKEMNVKKITQSTMKRRMDHTFIYDDYIVSGEWFAERRDGTPTLVVNTDTPARGWLEYVTTEDEFEVLLENYKADPKGNDDNEILIIMSLDWFKKNYTKWKRKIRMSDKVAIFYLVFVIVSYIISILYNQ